MDKEARAGDAMGLLNNPVFRDALQAVRDRLEVRSLSLKTTDTEEGMDIHRCKQLLVGIEREIKRFIMDGKVQSITDEKVSMFKRAKL